MKYIAWSLALLGAATASGSAQPQQPTVKTATAAVLIDVTVVDSNGRAVVENGLEEFELTEDGKRQQIVSALLVQPGNVRGLVPRQPDSSAPAQAAETAGTSGPAATAAVDATASVTAILFDRLSPEVRPLAHRAALAYVGTLSPHDYAG